MTSIIIFGKPRSFESYEYGFNGVANRANMHTEPLLKPDVQFPNVFHFCTTDGFAFYEYYTHALGYESDRAGLTFGVCIKTDRNLDLLKAKEIIRYFYDIFHSVLLENKRYKVTSLLDTLQNLSIEWDKNDIQQIQNIENNTQIPRKQGKNILLLEDSNMKNVSLVDTQIKEFAETYIFDNKEILAENSYVLRAANNNVFKILNGKIVPHNKISPEEEINLLQKELVEAQKNIALLQTENNRLKKQSDVKNNQLKETDKEIERLNAKIAKIDKLDGEKSKRKGLLTKIFPTFKRKSKEEIYIDKLRNWYKKPIFWLFFIAAIVFYLLKDEIKTFFREDDNVIVEQPVPPPEIVFNTYEEAIQNNLILLSEIKHCKEDDISFDIVPKELAQINYVNGKFELIVNVEEQKKHKEIQQVTIIAIHKTEGKLGQKNYNIAARKTTEQPKITFSGYTEAINSALPNLITITGNVNKRDIQFTVSPDNVKHLIEIDVNNNKLRVKENPLQNTSITITATYNGVKAGEKSYTIAPKAETNKTETQLIISNSFGTISTNITLPKDVREITFTPNVKVSWGAVEGLVFSYPSGFSAKVTATNTGTYSIVATPDDKNIKSKTITIIFQ